MRQSLFFFFLQSTYTRPRNICTGLFGTLFLKARGEFLQGDRLGALSRSGAVPRVKVLRGASERSRPRPSSPARAHKCPADRGVSRMGGKKSSCILLLAAFAAFLRLGSAEVRLAFDLLSPGDVCYFVLCFFFKTKVRLC